MLQGAQVRVTTCGCAARPAWRSACVRAERGVLTDEPRLLLPLPPQEQQRCEGDVGGLGNRVSKAARPWEMSAFERAEPAPSSGAAGGSDVMEMEEVLPAGMPDAMRRWRSSTSSARALSIELETVSAAIPESSFGATVRRRSTVYSTEDLMGNARTRGWRISREVGGIPLL